MSSSKAFNPIFAAEQKAQNDTISWELGENGSAQLTEYGLCSKSFTPEYVGALCALNAKLTRSTTDKRPITKCSSSHHSAASIGCDESQIKRLFTNVINSVSTAPDAIVNKVLLDLVIMMFNLRDIRGDYGKGERTLSYWMFFMLYSRMPNAMNKYIPEIPNYGSWADLNNIYAMASGGGGSSWAHLLKGHNITTLKNTIASVYSIQIQEDIGDKPPSLAGKWIPKEGRSFDKKTRMGKHIAKTMYPDLWAEDFKKALRKYRKTTTFLTKKLDVAERKMSSAGWSDINFNKVPGRCMAKHTKAWRNVDKTGNLRVDEQDRIKCSENYQDYIASLSSGKVTAKGKTMFVHELAMKLSSGCCSHDETILYESMMDAHINSIAEAQKESGNTLGNTVIIADVSGSMTGDPMAVAYAMAVIASHPKIANPAWANKVITFSDNPEWISIQYPYSFSEFNASQFGRIMGVSWDSKKAGSELSWTEKLKMVRAMPWGCSTNFISTLNLVSTRAIEANVSMPNILCVSDMQWNAAAASDYRGYGEPARCTAKLTHGPLYNFTMSDMDIRQPTTLLREVKKVLRKESCGADFTTIMWNVRGAVSGHAGAADEAQFVEVSGFSTNMLKVFLNEGTLESKTGDSGATSWSTLRAILDHTDYDRIREIANLLKPWRNTNIRPLSAAERTLLPTTNFVPVAQFPHPVLVRSTAIGVASEHIHSNPPWPAPPAHKTPLTPNLSVSIPEKKLKASSKNLSSEDSSEWSYDFSGDEAGVTRMNTFAGSPPDECVPPTPAPSPNITELVKRMAEMEEQNQRNMSQIQLMMSKLLEKQ